MKPVLIMGMLAWLLGGCNYEASVPTYIYIEEFDLTTDKVREGSDSELITDAWIYLDDESVGVFELPAKVPILSDKAGKLDIVPGIKRDGISGARAINHFYTPFDKEFNPQPATVDTIVPSITYKDGAVFPLIEDFESGNDFTNMSRESTGSEVFEGSWSGVTRLDAANTEFYSASYQYELPQNGERIFLEMNYRNTAEFDVSILVNNLSDTYLEYAVTVTPKEEWNKIYVDLTEEVNSNKAVNYRLVFSGNLPSGASEGTFYFDNIKIVHL